MSKEQKGYKGVAMEGLVASWYARITRGDHRRFAAGARTVAERAPAGAHVLEIAPGPGYLAIAIAKGGRRVTGLDISHSFVRIAGENASREGVSIDFQQGDAAHMPFPDASFDFVVSMAAFKNFADPVGALNEIHRVLRPGGGASIIDLRKDASMDAIKEEVRGMGLSGVNAALTRWTFRSVLLKRAYTEDALRRMAAESRFGTCEIVQEGVGFDLRLSRPKAPLAAHAPLG